MRLYTAHLRPGRVPVLVREGFSVGALLFGPLWLLGQGAWLPAVVVAALWGLAGLLPHPEAFWLALAVLAGVLGRDLCRWALARRGYALSQVVAGPDADAALARLLASRSDLAGASLAELRPAGL